MLLIACLCAWVPALARAHDVGSTLLGEAVTQLAAGGAHTCALTAAGAVHCWGWNYYGQLGDGTTTVRTTPVAVTGLDSGVAAIAAGGLHACALTTAGAVLCWGRNSDGQLGDGTNTHRPAPVAVAGLGSGVAAIAAGSAHTCALTKAGAVQCWGNNANSRLGDGTTESPRRTPVAVAGLGSGVAAITAGNSHTCALTTAGAVRCWGSNTSGQVGDGSSSSVRFTPVNVAGLDSGVAAITAGSAHTCALTTAGAVQCWGYNDDGRLGDGAEESRYTPVAVNGLDSGVAAIAAGGAGTCALTTAGAVRCWGYNGDGQLGDGTTTFRTAPVAVTGLDSGVAAIAAGVAHTCALTTAGAVQCWGNNIDGRLGDGTTTSRTTPVAVAGLGSGVAAIAAGTSHTCALTTAGAVQCWGWNGNGRLGDGTTTSRPTPTAVTGLDSGVAAIAAGSSHTCALTTEGAVWCWGYNDNGPLGNGTYMDSSTPVSVTGLGSGVAAITTGTAHTCALTTAGAVQCWGRNQYGQLGNGTLTNSSTPVAVAGLGAGTAAGAVAAIAAGSDHTCALTSAGAAFCWGRNFYGQLGDGTASNFRPTPVPVTGLGPGTVAAIAAGGIHTCARTSAGAVQCWGYNGYGELGNSTTPTNSSIPVAVTGLGSGTAAGAVTDITAGLSHTCALTTAGAVRCWGWNDYGQLGDGTTTDHATPVAVAGLGSGTTAGAVADITAGLSHTCALTTAGAVRCWGNNNYGKAPAMLLAGQALDFAPGSAGAPLATLAAGQSATLATGTPGTAYGTWTPGTCTADNGTLTATGPAGSLCGVWAAHAGAGPATAAAPTQMRLLHITQAAPTLALAASATGSTLGQSVTFTATFANASNPTGTITFMNGAATLCTATLPANTCSATLAAGAHSLTAHYAGDANNAAAASPPLTHTVNPATFDVPGGTAKVDITGPAGCTLTSLTLADATPADALPPNTTAPLGVLRFTATGCPTGASMDVRVDYPPGSLSGLSLQKYGPHGGQTGWFPHGTASGDTVTYAVTDGGDGDNDSADGSIADPFAPLLLAGPGPGPGGTQPIPTLGEWGALLLSALLAVAGRRRLQAKSASDA